MRYVTTLLVLLLALGGAMAQYVYTQRVQILEADGTPVSSFGEFGDGDGQFNWIWGAYLAVDGTSVYVADGYNNRVQRFDADGNFIAGWRSWEPAEPLNYTAAMTAMAGEVYTLNAATIIVRNSSGVYQRAWNIPGGRNYVSNYFLTAYGGSIYLAKAFGDVGSIAIWKFSPSGVLQRTIYVIYENPGPPLGFTVMDNSVYLLVTSTTKSLRILSYNMTTNRQYEYADDSAVPLKYQSGGLVMDATNIYIGHHPSGIEADYPGDLLGVYKRNELNGTTGKTGAEFDSFAKLGTTAGNFANRLYGGVAVIAGWNGILEAGGPQYDDDFPNTLYRSMCMPAGILGGHLYVLDGLVIGSTVLQLSAPVDRRFGIHHCAFVQNGNLYYQNSDAGATSWNAPVLIAAGGNRPSLIVMPDWSLSVVFQYASTDVQRMYSRDNGDTWTTS